MKYIDLRKFILENHDAIYRPKMRDHRLNVPLIREYQARIQQLQSQGDSELASIITAYKDISLCITDNILYVSFEEYLDTLREICDDIIQYIGSQPEKDVVFYIDGYKKSSFWVFMLCCAFFIREDIPLTVIHSARELAYIKDSIVIYPDDMSYSGVQMKQALHLAEYGDYEDSLNVYRENGILIVPLLSRISLQAITTLQIEENRDLFYLCDKIVIIEPVLNILYKNNLISSYEFVMNQMGRLEMFFDLYEEKPKRHFIRAVQTAQSLVEQLHDSYNTYDEMQEFLEYALNRTLASSSDDILHDFILYYCLIYREDDNLLEDDIHKLNTCINNAYYDHRGEFMKIYSQIHALRTEPIDTMYKIDILSKIKRIFGSKLHTTTLICFQHKMADAVSIPMFLFHNGVYIAKEGTEGFQLRHIGSFFENCPMYDEIDYIGTDVDETKRCPPTYYKSIQYTYENQPIQLKNKDIEFTYNYYEPDKPVESPITPLSYKHYRKSIKQILNQ